MTLRITSAPALTVLPETIVAVVGLDEEEDLLDADLDRGAS